MLFSLSKNTLSYCFFKNNKLFLLVISSFKGWGIVSFDKKVYILLKNKSFFCFLTHNKSFLKFLQIFFLGLQKGYFQYLKIKGMGYKFTKVSGGLVIKFGFSHRIIVKFFLDVYCKFITRYLLYCNTRSLWSLQRLTQSFRLIRKKDSYKKKGIFIKGNLIWIKTSSKKSKF